MYEFMKGQKERGVGLMPEDEAAYLAYKLVLERNELTDDEKRRVFNTDDKIADIIVSSRDDELIDKTYQEFLSYNQGLITRPMVN